MDTETVQAVSGEAGAAHVLSRVGAEGGAAPALSRRRFLAVGGMAAAAGLLATACGASSTSSGGTPTKSSSGPGSTSGSTGSGSMSSVSFQLGWIANVENMGPYVALNHGYYRQEGVDVTLVPGGPNVTTEPLVVSGKAFTALDTVDTIARARLNGAPLKVVAVTLQNNPSGVMSLAKSPIRTPQDLVGKRLGIQSSAQAEYEAFLKLNGVDPSKVKFVPVQYDPSPLVDGQVDAFASFQTSEPVELRLQGVDTYTFLLADFHYNLWSDAYMVNESTLTDPTKRKALVDLLRGSVRGWQAALADPDAAASIIVDGFGKSLGLTLKGQQVTAAEFVPLIRTPETMANGLLTMSAQGIVDNIATMKTEGITISASELFDTSVLEEVYSGPGAPSK